MTNANYYCRNCGKFLHGEICSVCSKVKPITRKKTFNARSSVLYFLTRFGNMKVLYVGIHSGDCDNRLQGHYSAQGKTEKDLLITGLKASGDIAHYRHIRMLKVIKGSSDRVMLAEYYCYVLLELYNVKHYNTGVPSLPSFLKSRKVELTEIIKKEPRLPINPDMEYKELDPLRKQILAFIDQYTVDTGEKITLIQNKLNVVRDTSSSSHMRELVLDQVGIILDEIKAKS